MLTDKEIGTLQAAVENMRAAPQGDEERARILDARWRLASEIDALLLRAYRVKQIPKKFTEILPETYAQRDAAGKVRWLYMVNWIVSVLSQCDMEFSPAEFYKSIRAYGARTLDAEEK